MHARAKIYVRIHRKASLHAGGALWLFLLSLFGYICFEVAELQVYIPETLTAQNGSFNMYNYYKCIFMQHF